MGEGAFSRPRQDWAHEGCCRAILAAGDSGEQSAVGAGQRDCQISPRSDEGKCNQECSPAPAKFESADMD